MRSTNVFFTCGWLISLGSLCACDPGGASPMPEPPAMEIGKVSTPAITALAYPVAVQFEGAPGAATGASFVRVTDLDTTDPVVVAVVKADGSFAVSLFLSPNDELRFQSVNADGRSEPVDVQYVQGTGLVLVVRPDCIALDPGYDMGFAGPSTQTLGITNHCAAVVAKGATTMRLGLADFSVTSTTGDIAVGATANIDVAFAPKTTGEPEDVLFVPIDVAGQSVRYPVTLYGPTRP